MFKRLLLGAALTAATTLTLASAGPAFAARASAGTPAPGKVANKLFRAWLAADRAAAAKAATPAAVKTIFTYAYRAPDRFDGCSGNVCRFVHTSVRVPGGLDGIAMVVTGSKVSKVYLSRHITEPPTVAKHLFAAWKRGDEYGGLEVATSATVQKLFKVTYDPRGVTYFFQGCSKEPRGYSCAYSYEGGAMLMHVRGSRNAGYEVRSISYLAD
ncbi:hypothetical protein [Nonomuraea rhodomycinica]|uniref:Uncharacterized protein n=1 Tax=Nonomuraea rhodomycinica TaxID=1712872 RepID=A0A7Y6IJX7_9ACTN|nr:hypothetical protein [Nonomuraea rhodomycinica]NUW39585.1 hypothetical protein [Nonomuraea rhodomycinica]